MQIVIEIDEKMYEDCKTRNTLHYSLYNFSSMIANGTPLPKGHGDLVDRIEVIKSLFDYYEGKKTIGQCVEDVQTIIESDGGKEDGEDSACG